MNRKLFLKDYIIVFIGLYSVNIFSKQEVYASSAESTSLNNSKDFTEQKDQNVCPRNTNGIAGKIILDSYNISDKNPYQYLVIRLLGVDYSKPENWIYEYYPNENGCFSLPNIPFGSSVFLKIWDTGNYYYNKVVNVYANKNPNFYEIHLTPETKILSESFSASKSVQLYDRAGICGKAIGLSPGDLIGTTIFMENASHKIFHATYSNNLPVSSPDQTGLSMNGYFCVFNLNSCKKNEDICVDNPNYKLNFKLKNGEIKKFDVTIPVTTFSDNNFYDLSAGVLRPVELYSLRDINKGSWKVEKNVKVTMNNSIDLLNEKLKGLSYFSSGDNIVKINYSFKNRKYSNKFFILKPREEIYTQEMYSKINSYQSYIDGEVFVDERHPLKLKIFNPDAFNLDENYFSSFMKQAKGAAFFSFDLEKYGIDKNFVQIEVRNIYGDIVLDSNNTYGEKGTLNLLYSDESTLNGIIYNLEPGFYQFFIKSTERQEKDILFTTQIQSYSNKIQVITEPYDLFDNDITEDQNSYILTQSSQSEENDIIPWNKEIYEALLNSDISFDGLDQNNSENLSQMLLEQNEFRKNFFNKYSADMLCNISEFKQSNQKAEIPGEFGATRLINIDPKDYYKL